MKTSTKVWDRIICFIFGLLLLTGGLWVALFYFDIPWLEENVYLPDLVDLSQLENINADDNVYQIILAATALLGLILGLWIIWANLRPNRVRRVSILEGNATVGLHTVADMVAGDLAKTPGVISTRSKVYEDSGERIARISITAEAQALPELDEAMKQAEQDIRAAVPEVEFSTEYLLQISQP